MQKNLFWFFGFVLFFAAFSCAASQPLPSFKPVLTPHVEATLFSEMDAIEPGSSFWIGLRLRMEDHWHTYWKNSGDSGAPTRLQWNLPTGFTASEIYWPVPDRIETPPLVNYGYSHTVFLLTRIQAPPKFSEKQVQLQAKASWLVCREECIPGDALLAVSVKLANKGGAKKSQHADLLLNAATKLPQSAQQNTQWSFKTYEKDGKVFLQGKGPKNAVLQESKLRFFPQTDPLLDHAFVQTAEVRDNTFILTLKKSTQVLAAATQLSGVIAGLPLQTPSEALELTLFFSSASPFAMMLLFAFLGGLILNLMPCVFPVLSLKILGFAQLSGHRKAHIRLHGFVFTLGVLVSFWLLAALLLALRAGGEQLGWGFQLQSPGFLIFLSVVLFIFSLNLLGVFEMGLFLMGVGTKVSSRSDLVGSFFTGVLATVVATPCTAPFMGVALGFALSQSAAVAISIFTALGLGMAAPYLIFSLNPALLKFLPKPGRWMDSLKKIMAFPLLATVLWLGWVYSNQAGVDGVFLFLAGLLVIGFAFWCLGHWAPVALERKLRWVLLAAVGLLSLLGLWMAFSGVPSGGAARQSLAPQSGEDSWGQQWVEYTPERLEEVRAQGRPVFIDFTAAWCVTCKVNERLVFRSQEVRDKFKSLGAVLMKADWTNRNPEITKVLASFGRSGVPLYVIYPQGQESQARVLPEVVTAAIVLKELDTLQTRRK